MHKKHVKLKVIWLSLKQEDPEIQKEILRIIDEQKPESVKELIITLKKTSCLKEQEILLLISKMQAKGQIVLKNQMTKHSSLSVFLRSDETMWYWITIIMGFVAALFFFVISETSYPLISIRNIAGPIFVLILPGYALGRILFPGNSPINPAQGHLEGIERLALSVGISVVLVSIVGLVIYFLIGSLHIPAIVITLLVFTLLIATISIVREYSSMS